MDENKIRRDYEAMSPDQRYDERYGLILEGIGHVLDGIFEMGLRKGDYSTARFVLAGEMAKRFSILNEVISEEEREVDRSMTRCFI